MKSQMIILDIMEEISTTIGFQGITTDDIRFWTWEAWEGNQTKLKDIPDTNMFRSDTYSEVRLDAVRNICMR